MRPDAHQSVIYRKLTIFFVLFYEVLMLLRYILASKTNVKFKFHK